MTTPAQLYQPKLVMVNEMPLTLHRLAWHVNSTITHRLLCSFSYIICSLFNQRERRISNFYRAEKSIRLTLFSRLLGYDGIPFGKNLKFLDGAKIFNFLSPIFTVSSCQSQVRTVLKNAPLIPYSKLCVKCTDRVPHLVLSLVQNKMRHYNFHINKNNSKIKKHGKKSYFSIKFFDDILNHS